MCSNFEIIASAMEVATALGLDNYPELSGPQEIRPTDPALVVTGHDTTQHLRFGLVVPWDKAPLINARIETLMEKPTFRPILKNRCLIPATAWFEWRKDGKASLKNRIFRADKQLLTFAALFDGNRFVVLTCPSSPAVSHIHHRMPVLLDKQNHGDWLNPDVPTSHLARMLNPNPDLDLEMVETIPSPPRQGDLFI